MVKKLLSLAACMTIAIVGLAQETKFFKVGPYDVAYKDEYDYSISLRKGVDLYEFFHLKRDTVMPVQASSPLKSGWQVDASFSMPRYVANGTSNVFGVDVSWKKCLGNTLWFNAGLSLAYSTGKYVAPWEKKPDWAEGFFTENIIEVGVPFSIEWTRLDKQKASLYVALGVVPTFYTGAKGKEKTDEATHKTIWTDDSRSGIFVAPRVDFGGYVPVGKQLVRVGVLGQYDINCSTDGGDLFKERIGRFFVGGNVGLIF